MLAQRQFQMGASAYVKDVLGKKDETVLYTRLVFLKACLNGNRVPGVHPALPLTARDLAGDAAKAVQAGADALHVHPRDETGLESLSDKHVGAALTAVRKSCPGVPVGVSTGTWIEPDVTLRVAAIAAWTVLPDFASVNLSEPGAAEVCGVLARKGVGLEAGLWSAADARFLLELAGVTWLRLLLEPRETTLAAANATVDATETVLKGVLPEVPRLLHGVDETVWPLLGRAARSGYGSRIGLEDTLCLADGSRASDNASLISAVRAQYPRF